MHIRILQRWLVVQAVLWLAFLIHGAVAIAGRGLAPVEFIVLGGLVVASWWVLWLMADNGRTIADWVTLGRFAVLLTAAAWVVAAGEVTWGTWAVLLAAVCADLLDGYCARRWGGSPAGAVLDMETDQLVTLVLVVLACNFAAGPVWLLVLPAMRYLYILYVALLGNPTYEPKPRDGDNSRGRFICALTLVMVLVCLMPGIPPVVGLVASAVATVALVYSFGSDAVFLAQRRFGLRATR